MVDFQALVQQERAKQHAKWGEQNLIPFHWVSVLAEEMGELARAINHVVQDDEPSPYAAQDALKELIHTAAVCQAMWESGKRNGWL